MRSVTVASILILLLSPRLSANSQTARAAVSATSATDSVAAPGRARAECPVRLSAYRYGFSASMRDTGRGPSIDAAQSLKLVLDPADASTVVRIAGRVHGSAGTAQVLPVRPQHQAQAGDRTEPFEFRAGTNGFEAVHYLLASGIPTVTQIEITEVDFRDGSAWRSPRAETCSIAPSLFVLVSASVQ